MVDHSMMRLGKKPARRDMRVLALAGYTRALPPPPEQVDWTARLQQPLGMMLNDKLGDCTCAAIGHAIQVWTSYSASGQATVLDQSVLTAYEGACGYRPGSPSTDQGGVEVEVLNWWLRNPVMGHTLAAFASVQPAHETDIRDAINLFGGCYIGLALPTCAQSQDVWNVPPGGATGDGEPGSWGGHAVFVCAYSPRDLTCITWGQLKHMTWAFWEAYSDEAYALLSPDWLNKREMTSPLGFNYQTLANDLNTFR